MSSGPVALRALVAAGRSVAHVCINDAIITTENNLVILRLPRAGLRLFWPPDKARAAAAEPHSAGDGARTLSGDRNG